jgi:hypothetical protein
MLQLLITANAVPSTLICFTLMMEATLSSETSVFITATRHYISEDGIFLRFLVPHASLGFIITYKLINQLLNIPRTKEYGKFREGFRLLRLSNAGVDVGMTSHYRYKEEPL